MIAYRSRARALPFPLLLVVLVVIAALAAALGGCEGEQRQRIEVAADYVRCSVEADYDGMSRVVAEDARPYCYAMASAPQPEERAVSIVNETWDEDSLIFEIAFGPTSTFLRLSPPADENPDAIMVESWNKAGARSTGTLTVESEKNRLVVTQVDGEPIEKVLSGGSGGL